VLTDQTDEPSNYAPNCKIQSELAQYRLQLEVEQLCIRLHLTEPETRE